MKDPGQWSEAISLWEEKLDFLRAQEAITADPAQKFALKKQIEEAEAKIRELSGQATPVDAAGPQAATGPSGNQAQSAHDRPATTHGGQGLRLPQGRAEELHSLLLSCQLADQHQTLLGQIEPGIRYQMPSASGAPSSSDWLMRTIDFLNGWTPTRKHDPFIAFLERARYLTKDRPESEQIAAFVTELNSNREH